MYYSVVAFVQVWAILAHIHIIHVSLQRLTNVLYIKIYVAMMFVLMSQEIICVYVDRVTKNLQIRVVKVHVALTYYDWCIAAIVLIIIRY